MTGISSRATKGKVTKMVARTIPGTAKMILRPWASSQGPKKPCSPKSTTNISPATTGETENGRSMKVISGFAAEIELGDGPGRRQAEQDVQRHADGRHQQGQPNGRQGIRLCQGLP